ncbi:MAG: hypothetical protein ACLFNZ_10465 [Spirochaetaceae bacterium]
MNNRENPASFAHGGVRISALVPETWAVTEAAANHLRFIAPPHPAHQEHPSTFSIRLGEPEGFSPEDFQDFCDTSQANLKEKLPGFELRTVDRFTLSSFVEVHAIWYNSMAESGLAFAQMQALGLLDRYNMYLINAATLKNEIEFFVHVLYNGLIHSIPQYFCLCERSSE